MTVTEAEPDVFAAAKAAEAAWDEALFRADRMAGALIQTVCPHCNLNIGAMVRNTDTPWLDLVCPVCKREFTERDGVLIHEYSTVPQRIGTSVYHQPKCSCGWLSGVVFRDGENLDAAAASRAAHDEHVRDAA